MRGYALSPRASADIDEIWDYTAQRWDADQAERYVRLIQDAIETVAADPQRARPCDGVRAGYRRYRVGSHVVFFRLVGRRIEIMRILHQRMDFDRHL